MMAYCYKHDEKFRWFGEHKEQYKACEACEMEKNVEPIVLPKIHIELDYRPHDLEYPDKCHCHTNPPCSWCMRDNDDE